jgi:hypothetical protein
MLGEAGNPRFTVEGSTMSYASAASSKSTSRVVLLTQAVRRSWTKARYADRQLMAMRTDLTRHVG